MELGVATYIIIVLIRRSNRHGVLLNLLQFVCNYYNHQVRRKMSWTPGDWMCGRCQHSNFKRRDTCQLCGYPKCGGPDPSTFTCNTPVKAGDWFCTNVNCGVHNFASRSSCYMCGALKSYHTGVCGGPDSSYPPGWKPGDWICPR